MPVWIWRSTTEVEYAVRGGVFVALLVPFALLLQGALGGDLGPDPAERIMHVTGEWGARALILCLLVTPLRPFVPWRWFMKLRRMLGLYAFFYGCVHFLTFGHFYLDWSATLLWVELTDRPYISVGFLAWLAMLPLAITSTRRMQRALKRNWLRLHQLVYPAAALICVHILWQARSDIGEPLLYIIIFALLGLVRVRPLRKVSA